MELTIRELQSAAYQPIWDTMRAYTSTRDDNSQDEVWLLEHFPVFTQGQAGKAEHLLDPKGIPVIQSDRGGQITFHGPGQLMLYTLFDLKRLGIGPRQLVMQLEQTVINLLAEFQIMAHANRDAPGVYVNESKICSIGLRVRRGCCYHGIALNVAMDLTPFSFINPCGYQGLKMSQISDYVQNINVGIIKSRIIPNLCQVFGYTKLAKTTSPWSPT